MKTIKIIVIVALSGIFTTGAFAQIQPNPNYQNNPATNPNPNTYQNNPNPPGSVNPANTPGTINPANPVIPSTPANPNGNINRHISPDTMSQNALQRSLSADSIGKGRSHHRTFSGGKSDSTKNKTRLK